MSNANPAKLYGGQEARRSHPVREVISTRTVPVRAGAVLD